MIKFLVNNSELAGWVIGILLSIVSVLFGTVIYFLKDIILGAKQNSGKISKINSNLIEFKNVHAETVNSIYTAEKNIWEELLKLRRAVEEGNLVIGRRKEEIIKLREDTFRIQRKLEEHHRLHIQFFRSIRARKSEAEVFESEIQKISAELLLIKNKKENKDD